MSCFGSPSPFLWGPSCFLPSPWEHLAVQDLHPSLRFADSSSLQEQWGEVLGADQRVWCWGVGSVCGLDCYSECWTVCCANGCVYGGRATVSWLHRWMGAAQGWGSGIVCSGSLPWNQSCKTETEIPVIYKTALYIGNTQQNLDINVTLHSV